MPRPSKLVVARRQKIIDALSEVITAPDSSLTPEELYHFEFVASAYGATGVMTGRFLATSASKVSVPAWEVALVTETVSFTAKRRVSNAFDCQEHHLAVGLGDAAGAAGAGVLFQICILSSNLPSTNSTIEAQ